ncbi:MAG: GatB/YqeY domain-containing protein [Verrucomicrobiae bacterium]|nr:GatB/YqeY domain-containing protein [Verrucomicrobiae bacterium]
MPLPLERLDAEIKAAMIARDTARVALLRLLKSALKYHQIEKRLDALSEADFLGVVQKQIKQRLDSIESYRAAGRGDLLAKEERELALLKAYLPQALTPEEMEALVRAAIAETGATSKNQIGVVMKAALAKAAGRADGRSINAVALRLLGVG